MSNYLFILNAPSSGGKDLIYEIIASYLPCYNIKFAQPCKTAFEQWLGLRAGALNDQSVKQQYVTNPITGEKENFTYGDILVNAYWQWDKIYEFLTVGYVFRQMITNSANLVFTDIRKNTELSAVNKYIDIMKPSAVVLVSMSGRGIQKSVDGNVDFLDLNLTHSYIISNTVDTPKERLIKDVNYILEKCKAI